MLESAWWDLLFGCVIESISYEILVLYTVFESSLKLQVDNFFSILQMKIILHNLKPNSYFEDENKRSTIYRAKMLIKWWKNQDLQQKKISGKTSEFQLLFKAKDFSSC